MYEGGEFITNRKSTAKSSGALTTINANPSISYAAVPIYANGGIPSGAANLPTTSGIGAVDAQMIVNAVIANLPKQYIDFDAFKRFESTYTETVSNADISA